MQLITYTTFRLYSIYIPTTPMPRKKEERTRKKPAEEPYTYNIYYTILYTN